MTFTTIIKEIKDEAFYITLLLKNNNAIII
jgi:hypothetical protein